MVFRIGRHLDTDVCERYALNHLTGDALVRHEEHLLICERCQFLQESVDEFVKRMKRALSRSALEQEGQPKQHLPP